MNDDRPANSELRKAINATLVACAIAMETYKSPSKDKDIERAWLIDMAEHAEKLAYNTLPAGSLPKGNDPARGMIAGWLAVGELPRPKKHTVTHHFLNVMRRARGMRELTDDE